MRATAAIRSSAPKSARRRLPVSAGGPTVVAVWDVGAAVAQMDEVFEKWNRLNGSLRFVQVFISAPRQTLIAGERTIQAAVAFNAELQQSREQLAQNLFVDGAVAVAEAARKKGGYDKIALLTPYALAFIEDGRFCFNYYSGSWRNVTFISAFEMRTFAKKAGRSFTRAMCALLLAQILQNRYHPLIGFHYENTGCIFDHNAERHTVVNTFRAMRIEASCLERIPESDRAYVQKLVDVLAE